MQNHSLIEIRTGRDSQKNADVMMELFSVIPSFHDEWYAGLLWPRETLSFEISLDHQIISYYLYVPDRLIEYIKSTLGAHYPEATITPHPQDDYLSYFHPQANPSFRTDNLFSLTQSLVLENEQAFPLKDYREFSPETDSLAPLLSHLSQGTQLEKAVIQLIVGHDDEHWKARYENLINPSSSTDSSTNSTQMSGLEKSLLESKIHAKCLNVNLNVALVSTDRDRAWLFFDGILDALNNLRKPESNALKRKIQALPLPNRHIQHMLDRRLVKSTSFHLSVFELASIYHFPNQLLSTIPNLSWGKNLLGEPPENLPIVRKEYDPAIKREINVFAQTTFKNETQKYGIRRVDRRRHMYVIGKTGTGKSTMLANMAINDLRNGEGLCFIDPHGDAIDLLLN